MFAEQLAGDLEVWKGSFGAQGHHNGLGLRTLVERQTLRLLFLMRWPCSLASDLGSRTRLLAPMYHSDVQV